MAKFILIYRGPATPVEDMTPEQGEEQMQAWGAWIGKVGSAMTELGAPFGGRAALAGDGTDAQPADLNGYTVVEVDDLNAAKALCDGHPFLSTGEAKYVVDIYELAPVEM
jgi:hypothetical protein